MFTRPTPVLPDEATKLSHPAPLHMRRRKWLRLGQRLMAGLLVVIAAAAFLVNVGYVVSDQAVVTAQVVSIRAPIEGIIESGSVPVGHAVSAGLTLARIVNPLLDAQPEAALRLRVQRLQTGLQAMRDEHARMQGFLADLDGRIARHHQARVYQLGLEADRAEQDRAAKATELQQLIRDMNRKRALRGTLSEADIEQSVTAVRVAAQQVASLERQAAEARAATGFAEQGVIVEANGGSDVAYSEQRADEIRVRLLEQERTISDAAAELKSAQAEQADAAARAAQLHDAKVLAPTDGMVWRVAAGTGERVGAGDLIAQVVDCGSAFLAVNVPQDRLGDIDLAATAKFRLSGEHEDRTGRISAVTGDAAIRDNGALAAAPPAGTRPVGTILVAVPPSPNTVGGCLVGRTARVRLPAARGGWLDRIMRLLPV